MNSALDNLYNKLLRQVEDGEPEEEITEAEKAKQWLQDKQVTIEKLKEVMVYSNVGCADRACGRVRYHVCLQGGGPACRSRHVESVAKAPELGLEL